MVFIQDWVYFDACQDFLARLFRNLHTKTNDRGISHSGVATYLVKIAKNFFNSSF